MAAIAAVVAATGLGHVVEVHHHQIEVAVVVIVAVSGAASNVFLVKVLSGLPAETSAKRTISLVANQRVLLRRTRGGRFRALCRGRASRRCRRSNRTGPQPVYWPITTENPARIWSLVLETMPSPLEYEQCAVVQVRNEHVQVAIVDRCRRRPAPFRRLTFWPFSP